MEVLEEFLLNLFGSKPVFIKEVSGFNRHLHRVYYVGGKKIIIKKFQGGDFAKREIFFYNILKERCNVPKVYASGEDFLITDFIKSYIPNVLVSVRDWAKVHSYFLGSEILSHPLIAQHNLKNLPDFILSHPHMFGLFSEKLAKELTDGERIMSFQTIIHGDLYGKNILTEKNINYYIDFEFSGSGHPTRDLALLLLNYPKIKEEIIEIYRNNISFDYGGIEKDIKKELLGKGTQLIAGLKNLNMPLEQKKKIHRNLLHVLNSYL